MKKILALTLFIFLANSVNAQNYHLHSVYMYSFIKYVQWPTTGESDEFVIGVLGDSPIEQHLRKMAAIKKAGSKVIKVKKVGDLANLGSCQMLFIPKETSKVSDVKALIRQLGNESVLVVTEGEGLGNLGSNINFVIRKGKLAFEMNKLAMERAKLEVSTDLARFAIMI